MAAEWHVNCHEKLLSLFVFAVEFLCQVFAELDAKSRRVVKDLAEAVVNGLKPASRAQA